MQTSLLDGLVLGSLKVVTGVAGSVLAPVEPRVEAGPPGLGLGGGTPLRSSPLVLALRVPGNPGTVRMRLSPSDAVTPADALPWSFSLAVGRHTLGPIPGTSAPGGLRGL